MLVDAGPDGARFSSSSLLILFNRIFSISTALLILTFKSKGVAAVRKRLRPASPLLACVAFLGRGGWARTDARTLVLRRYGAVAFFNFLSTTAQYEALKYVS